MTRKPTIRDVAQVAGVSIKTVSRVTNGDDGVAESTAARVQAAITELGYRVNPLARSLRTGSDNAVGLILESISDPFFAGVADAVEEAARGAGMVVVIASAGETAEQERAVVNAVLERSPRGMLIVPCHLDYEHEEFRLGPHGVPVVFVDRPGIVATTDTVGIDNIAAGRFATGQLIAHGHRRIGFIATHLTRYPLRARADGYRLALADADIEVDESLIVSLPKLHAQADSEVHALLAQAEPATAILTANAFASLAVVKALRAAQRPDIAVIAFDDFPMADSLNPAITVNRQDSAEIGRKAFELLMERISGAGGPGRHVVVPTTFVKRGSGELSPSPPRTSQTKPRTSQTNPRATQTNPANAQTKSTRSASTHPEEEVVDE
jgi:LacI family transcriptional regulator